ncbi:MAG: prolyl oligopeptidase family serine peptidase [Planctomycetes bacterium]|nr:prolyl oligopeptidase family serine peptidase [Planctomycetota bacterium]
MQFALFLIAAFNLGQAEPLAAGDHLRHLTVDKVKRRHWIHVPPTYDAKKPYPVVLALHGAMMDGKLMEAFTGLSKSADAHGFIVVYPNGTGPGGLLLTWNAGQFPGEKNNKSDDVKYLGKVLDDVEGVFKVDKKRVYVTGLSNGAMMSYRLASEISERFAAIAPVAGTLALDKFAPKRAVPIIHFHGTNDTLVPFQSANKKGLTIGFVRFRSVPDTIKICLDAYGCSDKAIETEIAMKTDKLRVLRKDYNGGKADVVLYTIEGGGHTWPGSTLAPAFLGLSTRNVSANDAMWEFFKKHRLK